MLLFVLILLRSGEVPGLLNAFVTGAVFGLAGDICLMIPGKRSFIIGLLAFLVGHIAYIIGFQPRLGIFPAVEGLMALGLAILVWRFGVFAAPKMRRNGLHRLRVPVLIYMMVISAMAWSAWHSLLDPGWPVWAAILVSAGALFFLVSDSILAWDRFIMKLPHARVLVMVTYHLAQAGILLGAIAHIQG
jgi:uncharacterized membrane protein YhhN